MEEETEKPTSSKETCRTCMSLDVPMVHIYSQVSNSPLIIDMLSACTSIQVNKEDGLPQHVCSNCFSKLEICFDFRIRAERTDKRLRQIHEAQEEDSDDKKIKMEVKCEPVKNEILDYDESLINGDLSDGNHSDDIASDSTDSESNKVLSELPKLRERRIKTYNEDEIDIKKTLPVKRTVSVHKAKYTCEKCGKQFVKLYGYERHLKTHDKITNKSHKCETCGKVFSKASKLVRHVAIHNPILKPFVCPQCNQRFKSHNLLLTHIVTHSSASLDSGLAPAGDKPEGENRTEDSDKAFTCTVCEAIFQSNNSLSAHMRKHRAKNRVLACQVCQKVFSKTSHLKRHEALHEDNRPFKCQLCPKSFIHERQLLEHTNWHNGVKPHVCPVCGKAFSQLSTLNSHVRVHTDKPKYLCPMCGKQFDSGNNLKQHVRRHTGEKKFVCKLCPGKFVSKGELQSHINTHTGARPYVCDLCGSGFTKTTSLSKHKRNVHMGIKPFECDVCVMRFGSNDHLRRHYRIHTGEKPYACTLCERAFTQSNDLVKHTRSHLGEKMYRCTECSEGFRLKTELRDHISLSHFVESPLPLPPALVQTLQYRLMDPVQLPRKLSKNSVNHIPDIVMKVEEPALPLPVNNTDSNAEADVKHSV